MLKWLAAQGIKVRTIQKEWQAGAIKDGNVAVLIRIPAPFYPLEAAARVVAPWLSGIGQAPSPIKKLAVSSVPHSRSGQAYCSCNRPGRGLCSFSPLPLFELRHQGCNLWALYELLNLSARDISRHIWVQSDGGWNAAPC